MAKLSDEEAAAYKKLQEKLKAPDAPTVGKSISMNVDANDPEQIKLAIKHGFLTAEEAAEVQGEGDNGGEPEGDEVPARKGYFNN